jgi:hypothetical protein
VFLLFADVFASMREDSKGLHYEFKTTPLRNAADWLLSGHPEAALSAFINITNSSGAEIAGFLGATATCWAMHDAEGARVSAESAIASEAIKDLGILSAVRKIRDASTRISESQV